MFSIPEGPALRHLAPLLGLALLAGCAGGGGAPAEPAAVAIPAAPDFAALGVAERATASHGAQTADDWKLFVADCGDCHSLLPPGKTAPPMASVMRRYAAVYPDAEDTRAAMVFWVRHASADWAVMPQRTLREHGVMPVQDMTVEHAERIVDYLLGLREEGLVREAGR